MKATEMKAMIDEAVEKMNSSKVDYGFSTRKFHFGELTCRTELVNTNSKRNEFRKIWWLDGKRIAAAKVAAL